MKYIILNIVIAFFIMVFTTGCICEKDENMSISKEKLLKDRISNPAISDNEAWEAIIQIRGGGGMRRIPLSFWADIANSKQFSDTRRLWAILQVFHEFRSRDSTLEDIGLALKGAKWLLPDMVKEVKTVLGYIPVDIVKGDSIFVIYPNLPSSDTTGIYIRVQGHPSVSTIASIIGGAFDLKEGGNKISQVGFGISERCDSNIIKILMENDTEITPRDVE